MSNFRTWLKQHETLRRTLRTLLQGFFGAFVMYIASLAIPSDMGQVRQYILGAVWTGATGALTALMNLERGGMNGEQ